MKILSLNTHSWLEKDSDQKFKDLVQKILQEDFDFICLQEINQRLTSPVIEVDEYFRPTQQDLDLREDNYARLLVEALREAGRTYYWSWAYNHIGYDRFEEGVAVLSKRDFRPHRLQLASQGQSQAQFDRYALLAELEQDGSPLTLVSLHTSWWKKGLEEEWTALTSHLSGLRGSLVLAGDFNSPTNQEGYQMILSDSLDLVDSHEVAPVRSGEVTILADIDGWEGNQENYKVDHIFLSRDLEALESRVVFDGEDSPVVSDHFGLSLTFERREAD